MTRQSNKHIPNSDSLSRLGCPVDQLEWLCNGSLSLQEEAVVEAHLAGCAACQSDVEALSALRNALRGVSAHTPEPRGDLFALVEAQLDKLSPRTLNTTVPALPGGMSPSQRLSQVWQSGLFALGLCGEHVRAQTRLIRRDLFWLPLLLIPLAGWVVYMAQSQGQLSGAVPVAVPEAAAVMAALLTALGVAFLYGQKVDPAREMTLATQTSPRLVLGVRCCVLFGYDLLLNCGVVLPLLAWQGVVTPSWFLTNWLAPLCCLSALILLLSILFNSATAVGVCALLCALRLIDGMQLVANVNLPWQKYYEGFWSQGLLLFIIALISLFLAFGILERKERYV